MADASGLTAAQAEANQIPYKNIALGNPAETFLNAWSVATGLKLKQQEFEGKMSALQQKNAQIEADSAMKDKLNEMKLMQMQQGMGMKEAAIGLREGKLQLDTDVFNQKVGDRKAMHDSVSGISRDFANLDVSPTDPNFMAKVDEILGNPDYQYAPPSFYSQQRNIKSRQQQNAVNNARQGIKSEAASWQHVVSNQLWGNQMNTDTNPVLHPEQYPDVPGKLTPEQESQLTWRQKIGIDPKPEPAPTGLKKIQQYVNGKPVGTPRQVPTQWLTDQAKKYQDIQDKVSNLPAVDKGAYSSLPLPSSKQQLQAGQVYDTGTDQGDMRWTGTGFVPP